MHNRIGDVILNCVNRIDELLTHEMRNDDNFIYAESIHKIIKYEKNYSVQYLQMRRESSIIKCINISDLHNDKLIYMICRELYSRYKLLLEHISGDVSKFFVKNGDLYYRYTRVSDQELDIEIAMEYSIIGLKPKQKFTMYGIPCVV